MTWPVPWKRRRTKVVCINATELSIDSESIDLLEQAQRNPAIASQTVYRVSLNDRTSWDYATLEAAIEAAVRISKIKQDARVHEFSRRLGRLNRRSTGPIACAKAAGWLDNLAVVLPTRIVNEDLGDFLEDINRRGVQGQSSFKIYLRTAAATFWLIANAVGYLVRTVVARKSA